MQNPLGTVRQLFQKDRETGVTMVEYALMMALIAIAVATFGANLSGSVMSVFSRIVGTLSQAS